MNKMKKLLLPVLSAFCVAGFVCAGTVTAKAEMDYSFADTKIVGAQVRMDDKGMRFVMEMSEADYQAFTAEGTTYSAGVLVIPSLVLGEAELTNQTAHVQTISFDDSYTPKKVGADDTASYHFNAVLTAIPYYSVDITARGFVTDGTNYAYTNTCERTVSQISATYYVDGSGAYDEYKETLEANILQAYNEVSATDAATFDEMTVTPVLNAANSVLIGSEVEGYSSTVTAPENMDNVFPVEFSVADDGVISIDSENKLTGNAFGKATVTATALGKTMGELSVSAIDTTLVKIGAGYTSDSYETYKTNYSASGYILDQFKVSNGSAFSTDQTNNAAKNDAEFVESAHGRTATSDKLLKMPIVSLNMDEYLTFMPRFTKEQVGLLIAAGYDTIEINAYSEVADDAMGLQHAGLNGRDFISAFTPNGRIRADRRKRRMRRQRCNPHCADRYRLFEKF